MMMTFYMMTHTLSIFGVGPRCRPLAAKIIIIIQYLYSAIMSYADTAYQCLFGGTPVSTEWFSDIPTNFGLPPVRCSQWHKKIGYLD